MSEAISSGTCTCGGAHCPEPAPGGLLIKVLIDPQMIPEDRRDEIKEAAAQAALEAILDRGRPRSSDDPDRVPDRPPGR
jgi:hypothetical protein